MDHTEATSFYAASFPLRHDIFGALDDQARALALRDARELVLRKAQILFRRGDRADGAYFIRRGIIKISIVALDGEQRIVAVQGPGSTVGDLGLIDGEPRGTTAEAMTDSELLTIGRSAFQTMVNGNPAIHAQISRVLTKRLRSITEEVTSAAFLPMRARIARALLRLAQLLGEHIGVDLYGIEQPIGQGDIAAMAGVTRESANRTLMDWRNEGVLGSTEQHKLVLNVRRLLEEAARLGES